MNTETRFGLTAGLAAYLIWGVLPLYLRFLTGIPAADVLANRILWSMVLVAGIVAATGGTARLRAAFAQPRLLLLLAASAAAVAVNWLIYTWAVLDGHVLDTSLGYFINPLISILFGVVLLGERLLPAQRLAVALAVAGVAVIAIARGALPMISLGLAFSFALYGLIRKVAGIDAISGLFVETLFLSPFALGWLLTRPTGMFEHPPVISVLLIAGGALTAIPLLLFGVAARRLPLSTLGVMQYIAPSIQFLLAIFVFKETVDAWQMLAFALIWAGLLVYARSLLQRPALASV